MDSEEAAGVEDGGNGEEGEMEGKGGILGVEGWYNVKRNRTGDADI